MMTITVLSSVIYAYFASTKDVFACLDAQSEWFGTRNSKLNLFFTRFFFMRFFFIWFFFIRFFFIRFFFIRFFLCVFISHILQSIVYIVQNLIYGYDNFQLNVQVQLPHRKINILIELLKKQNCLIFRNNNIKLFKLRKIFSSSFGF